MNSLRHLSFICSALLSLLAVSASAAEKKINPDMLKTDVALVQRIKGALGASIGKGEDIDKFMKVVMPSDVRVDRALGCGIRQVQMAVYGGYATVWLNVAVIDKKIVALDCKQSGFSDSWTQIAPDLQKAWGITPLKHDERSITIAEYVESKDIDAATTHVFGATKVASAPGSLAEPFALLMSPLKELNVGETCYFAATKPEGCEAIEKLSAAGRYDLIRTILRGPSPEGRAYAALILNKENKASPDDLVVEEKLKKLNIPVSVCHGCAISTESFTEVLAEKR